LTLVDASSLSIRTYSRPIFASAAAEATSFYHLPIDRWRERERENTLRCLNNKCSTIDTSRRIDTSIHINSPRFSAKRDAKSGSREVLYSSREKTFANCPFLRLAYDYPELGIHLSLRYMWWHLSSFVRRCGREIFAAYFLIICFLG